jgi:hypothetical protein
MPEAAAAEPPFFSVSVTKLVVLSICTFGLYEVYWFYENWKRLNQRQRRGWVPMGRAMLAMFFCYPFFKLVKDAGNKVNAGDLPAAQLAGGFIIASLCCLLPSPYLIVSDLTVFFLVPVQRIANRVNAIEAPGRDANDRFSAGNIATVVIGGLLLVLSFIVIVRPPKLV